MGSTRPVQPCETGRIQGRTSHRTTTWSPSDDGHHDDVSVRCCGEERSDLGRHLHLCGCASHKKKGEMMRFIIHIVGLGYDTFNIIIMLCLAKKLKIQDHIKMLFFA